VGGALFDPDATGEVNDNNDDDDDEVVGFEGVGGAERCIAERVLMTVVCRGILPPASLEVDG
jgi:hypothetical protein